MMNSCHCRKRERGEECWGSERGFVGVERKKGRGGGSERRFVGVCDGDIGWRGRGRKVWGK